MILPRQKPIVAIDSFASMHPVKVTTGSRKNAPSRGLVASAGGRRLFVALMSARALYQFFAGARSARTWAPPGAMIDAGGHLLHAVGAGCGTDLIVTSVRQVVEQLAALELARHT